MAFGLAVSDYNIQTGTYGNIIRVDISSYLPKSIDFVQLESSGGVKGDPVSSASTVEQLHSYLSDADCPDLAWNYSPEILTIFLKTYSGDDEFTRFNFAGNRKAQKTSVDTTNLDAPDERLELIASYAKNKAWLLKKNRTDPDLVEKTEQLEYELEN